MTLVLTVIISWAPVVAFAAKVVVVHGINGKDVASSQELPVDVAVDGNCALVGLTFGGSRLVELAAGSYNITVHPSSGACSTQPLITQTVVVSADANNVGLVAHLTDAASPKLTAFVNDSPKTAIFVNNAARSKRIFAGVGTKRLTVYYGNPLRNGEGIKIAEFANNRRLIVTLIGVSKRRPFYRSPFRSDRSVVVYLLGSAKNGFLVVSQLI